MKDERIKRKYEPISLVSVEMDLSTAILSGSIVENKVSPNEVEVEEMSAGFADSHGMDVGFDVKFE